MASSEDIQDRRIDGTSLPASDSMNNSGHTIPESENISAGWDRLSGGDLSDEMGETNQLRQRKGPKNDIGTSESDLSASTTASASVKNNISLSDRTTTSTLSEGGGAKPKIKGKEPAAKSEDSASVTKSSDAENADGEQEQQNAAFECNICLDVARDAVISMCGHLFCWPCLHTWLETRPNRQICPVCKAGIGKDKVVPLYGRGKKLLLQIFLHGMFGGLLFQHKSFHYSLV